MRCLPLLHRWPGVSRFRATDSGCLTSIVDPACRYRGDWFCPSGFGVLWLLFGSLKPPKHRLSPRSTGSPSNFVFKLTMLTGKTLSYFAVKTAWSYLQLCCHNTLASHRQTTDRQTTSYDNSGKCCKVPLESRKAFAFPVVKKVCMVH